MGQRRRELRGSVCCPGSGGSLVCVWLLGGVCGRACVVCVCVCVCVSVCVCVEAVGGEAVVRSEASVVRPAGQAAVELARVCSRPFILKTPQTLPRNSCLRLPRVWAPNLGALLLTLLYFLLRTSFNQGCGHGQKNLVSVI